MKEMVREKFRVKHIGDLVLKDVETGAKTKFKEYFEYVSFLGAGAFGFVVEAIEKDSGNRMAVKIVDIRLKGTIHCLVKEAEVLRSIPANPNLIKVN